MDNFIQALEQAAKGIQQFFEQMLTGLVDLLERIRQWIAAASQRVSTYLTKLFAAAGRLLAALSKLTVPYLPGIIAFTLGILGTHLWLIIVGGGWIVFITIIGLTYRKKRDEDASSE